MLGVTIGAPIIQYLGWRALFWGELPLMAIAAVLAVVVLPSRDRPDEPVRPVADGTRRRDPWRQLDWLGSLTLSGSVTAGLLALNLAPSWGFTLRRRRVSSGSASPGAGRVFVLHERRTPRPLIPLRYFRMRNFVFPLGARTFVNFSYMGGFFLFPILMERVYGYSETPGRSGVHRPAAHVLAGGPDRRLRRGARWGSGVSVVAGAVALTVSMVVFTQLGAEPFAGGHRRGPGPVRGGHRRSPRRRRPRRRPTRWPPTSSG